ncbi:glycoside hydrolase superfamily [Auriculariales sp. MPI-PUGE-AT-0066]|nr:glycoside hydrolase superfamily [Auriculariales sp. MPI-PUGE-AT-0066]
MAIGKLIHVGLALAAVRAVHAAAPLYKDPKAPIESRVEDLLKRMTLEEKVAQIIQGDIGGTNGWMNFTDPYDNTLTHNETALAATLKTRAGSVWAGYLAPYEKFVYGVTVGQKYLMEQTRLGIPALVQSEGLHGFTNGGATFASPISIAATFNPALLKEAAAAIATEAEVLGVNHIFAPVLDLARELRFGRVEEGYGEDPHLTGQMALAYVDGIQSGRRRNVSSTAIARVAATCKHFAAFGSPQGGLNTAQVSGGERELRTTYLPPFRTACINALSIMTAYSSYDGIPAVSNQHLLVDILRKEWGYKYWVTSDASAVDMLKSNHGTCDTRECCAKASVECIQGEMGGGTYTYETLPAQVRAGTVSEKVIDETVRTLLRTKFSLGLFENPYPYEDYNDHNRTDATKAIVKQMDQESIVLLKNTNGLLPLKKSGSIALLGPLADRDSLGDYIFETAHQYAVNPRQGFTQLLNGTGVAINYAQGCKIASNDQSGFAAAVDAAKKSDVAIVFVGTSTFDQQHLWIWPNSGATTGEHVDVSDLGLVGAQRALVQAVKAVGKPTIVVLISGKPVAEPWIADHADGILQQFYPGEAGGLALAEVIYGDVNPSGKLPVSIPRDVGTTPAFYNYLKNSRPTDAGRILDNGDLVLGWQYVLDSPVPLWSFGEGLSYTTFAYSNLRIPSSVSKNAKTFTITVNVKNSGAVAGKEVVQVYVTDVAASVVTPNQQMVGFVKVDLKAGEAKDVAVPIELSELAVWTLRSSHVVEPGAFAVKIGNSANVFVNGTLTVS